MRKILALTLVLGLALTACGLAVATADGNQKQKHENLPIGVRYEWAGEMGELELFSPANRLFIVHNSVGEQVFFGMTEGGFMHLPMPNSGFHQQEGWILRVDFPMDGVSFEVTDLDWEWN